MLTGDQEGNQQPWNKACRRLIWYPDTKSSGAKTPLHIAAKKGYTDIAKLLVEGYNLALQDEPSEWLDDETYHVKYNMGQSPWEIKDSADDIPLFVALKSRHDDFGVYMLSLETSSDIISLEEQECKSIRKLANAHSCPLSAEKIFEKTVCHRADILLKLTSEARNIHLGVVSIINKIAITYQERSVKLTTEMVDKLEEVLSALKSEPGSDGISHLEEAARKGEGWLVKLFLEGNKSLIEHSTQAWLIACQMGHVPTLTTFIEQCNNHDQFIELCRRNQQTPLHHVRKLQYEQYKELLGNPALKALINDRDNHGATPLHKATQSGDLGLTKALLETTGIKLDIEDQNRKTALDLLETPECISREGFFKLYEELLASPLMTQELKNRVDSNGDTPLHRAINRNFRPLIKALMQTKGINFEIKDRSGDTALDMIEKRCNRRSDDVFWFKQYKKLLAKPEMLQKLKNRTNTSDATPFHLAVEWDDMKLAKTLVQTKGLKFNIEGANKKTALDLIEERCHQPDNLWYELYKEVFENPNNVRELKNHVGLDGDTPLHRAIKRGDVKLAKTLLETKGVELDIGDANHTTALDLLDELHRKPDWGEMCREIRLDPSLKIFKFKYLQRRTSLQDMQNTISIVAALLATITFAAGITVPGGVDLNGKATLGTQAAFLVFSIMNTLAMCSSMVVLFSMVGAMIWEAHPKAIPLVDFCVFLLQLSLFGTILAFMTGIYAIMAQKVKWVAIVIIAFCSVSFVLAFYQVSTFWPPLYKPFHWLKNVLYSLVKCGKGNPSTSVQTSVSRFNNTLNPPFNQATNVPTAAALPLNQMQPSASNTQVIDRALSAGHRAAASEYSQQPLQSPNTNQAAIVAEPGSIV